MCTPIPTDTMIQAFLTAAALTIATLTSAVQSDTVNNALCELTQLDSDSSVEDFRCDFTQLQGNVYISGSRRKFAFPAEEQGKTYQRQNRAEFVRFIRQGQYELKIYQSGVKPIKPDP